jgi:CDGSH-type Zn-finger protein
VAFDNRIKVRANGPLLCTGDIEVYAADGHLLQKSADLVLCRCGHSANKPFCDGSHRDAGFEHAGLPDAVASDERETRAGALHISVRADAMLLADGPMTITSADDGPDIRRNRAALCRCGHSANKPFCDGSHRDTGFKG